jgi:hypothetical protein
MGKYTIRIAVNFNGTTIDILKLPNIPADMHLSVCDYADARAKWNLTAAESVNVK